MLVTAVKGGVMMKVTVAEVHNPVRIYLRMRERGIHILNYEIIPYSTLLRIIEELCGLSKQVYTDFTV